MQWQQSPKKVQLSEKTDGNIQRPPEERIIQWEHVQNI